MSNKDFQALEAICRNYGVVGEIELYEYIVESFLNGQLSQSKAIFSELRAITTMQYNYIESFSENLNVWFGSEGSQPIRKFFGINK
jgi:hypothetical protein